MFWSGILSPRPLRHHGPVIQAPQDIGDVFVAGTESHHLEGLDIEQGGRLLPGAVPHQPVVNEDIGNGPDLRLDLLAVELGAGHGQIGRRTKSGNLACQDRSVMAA